MSKRSDAIVTGRDRSAARAMLRASGMTDESFEGPIIAVFNTWTNMGPCNMNLDKLAVPVRAGIRAAGGTPVDFNSIAVSDGITMGSDGMRASLMSREVICDSIELAVRGHSLDGVIILVGCDKTIPAAGMALARMNVPGVVLYGGSIMPGNHKGKDLSVQDVFEAGGACAVSAARCLPSRLCHSLYSSLTCFLPSPFFPVRRLRPWRRLAVQRLGAVDARRGYARLSRYWLRDRTRGAPQLQLRVQ